LLFRNEANPLPQAEGPSEGNNQETP